MRIRAWGVLAAVAIAGAAVAGVPAGAQAPGAPGTGRIVAIGDIHGADAAFARLLVRTALTDAAGRWTGGRATFVQTGDYLDRGTGARAVVDRLLALERAAREGGGRTAILLGNHEVMNILRTFTDVTPAIFATFADGGSQDRLRKAYDEQVALARRTQVAALMPASREAWLEAHPPGYIEYVEAFSRGGRYGRWLRDRDAALALGGTIFMHAGIAPDSDLDVAGVNRTVSGLLRDWDRATDAMVREGLIRPFFTLQETVTAAVAEIERISAAIKTSQPPGDHVTREYVDLLLGVASIGRSALLAENGPMWYRGLTSPDSPVTDAEVTALLARLGATRFVLGHTVQRPARITPRFGGRAIAIDTGMLTEYFTGGRPSALVLDGGTLTAVYEDAQETIAPGGRP